MSKQKRIAVLTGAGMSKESGISTFRDNDGLWEDHRVENVATPEAWAQNPSLVLDFYNERRKFGRGCEPNGGHVALTALEPHFLVDVITQNVDDLHERAGSPNVLHLHGELNKVRPENAVNTEGYAALPWNGDLQVGDVDAEGNQLRPHVVWFGEDVPEISRAQEIVTLCDVLIVIGTSLSVYPAADLIYYLRQGRTAYIIDPAVEVAEKLKHAAGFPLQNRTLIPYYDHSCNTAENVQRLVAKLIAE